MNAKTAMTYEKAQYTEWGMMYGDRVSADTVARKLTGTYDWQGFCGEIMAISGMAKDVQRLVNQIIPGWKVFEHQYGDGSSRYSIGDYKQATKRHYEIY